MSSLGAALTQLASPPVSRQGSREGSADNSGAASPVAGSGRNSPKPEASDSLPGPVSLPQASSNGAKVGTDDSSYAAFVKQWCFAQSTPPAGGLVSPSLLSVAASPVPTPPAATSMSSVGMGFMGLSSFGSIGNGVGPRRQQAWPAEHQVGAGTSMGLGSGYGFPGFAYGSRPSSHDGPGMSVVGGELVF